MAAAITMKHITVRRFCAPQPSLLRRIHSSPLASATAHPITAHGPPPSAPQPAASGYGDRIDRRRRQAEMLQQGKEIRAAAKAGSGATSPLRKRFWKDVHVKEVEDGYQVHLDTRPVRSPAKSILTIPSNKPHLAHALALEWDVLVSAQQALKHHLIPLTSLISRVHDIIEAESSSRPNTKIREDIIRVVLRYLDTDTLLCWTPEDSTETSASFEEAKGERKGTTLRDLQIRAAQPIIAFLTTRVWPGVEIKPLDGDSILPTPQPQETKDVIRGWLMGLPAYELAALERGVLASKSLLIAARLVAEWSPALDVAPKDAESLFGIEEAAAASSVEVNWQTGMWGEVEDSHDVQKEDLRRQLGSVVLLVSGV